MILWGSLFVVSVSTLLVEAVDAPLCPNVNGSNTVFIPDSDCGTFWQCSNGVPIRHRCPPGLHFSSIRNICDYPKNADCKIYSSTTEKPVDENQCKQEGIHCPEDCGTPIFTPLSDCSKFCKCQNGHLNVIECPIGLHYNPSLNVCDVPENAGCDVPENICETQNITCEDDCDVPQYSPLANCSEYCQCLSGNLELIKCPDGLHFNPLLNVCDIPEKAGCDVPENICKAQNITCEDDCDVPQYNPLANCSEYCQCLSGNLKLIKCPDGLHFNPLLNVCDIPEKAGCDVPENICEAQNITCDDDCDVPQYTPLANCSEYCQCLSGNLELIKCPDGLHFNPLLNVCDIPEKAGCDVPENICKAQNITCEDDCDVPQYTPLANCSEYCQCLSGNLELIKCPDGLHFNPLLNVCDIPEKAGCDVPDNICETQNITCDDDCDVPQYTPLANCSEYCQCLSGNLELIKCPDGLHFNPILNVCDLPEKINCITYNMG